MARGIWIHVVVLMLKQAYLSPSERVYHTWKSCTPSGNFHNNKKPVHALPCSFARTVHVNIYLKKKKKEVHKHPRILGKCVYTLTDKLLSDIFTFSQLYLTDYVLSKTRHVIFIIHLKTNTQSVVVC